MNAGVTEKAWLVVKLNENGDIVRWYPASQSATKRRSIQLFMIGASLPTFKMYRDMKNWQCIQVTVTITPFKKKSK